MYVFNASDSLDTHIDFRAGYRARCKQKEMNPCLLYIWWVTIPPTIALRKVVDVRWGDIIFKTVTHAITNAVPTVHSEIRASKTISIQCKAIFGLRQSHDYDS